MTSYPAKRSPNRPPTHPGVVLAEVFEATGLTKTEIANRLAVTRGHLHDMIAGRKPVTPLMAAKLGKLFGNDGGVWARMQIAHDMWFASRLPDVSRIKTLEPA